MRITNTGRHGRRITFTKPGEGLRFIAGMNESHGNYESAAKLYRESGDEDAAKRCETALARRAAINSARSTTAGDNTKSP